MHDVPECGVCDRLDEFDDDLVGAVSAMGENLKRHWDERAPRQGADEPLGLFAHPLGRMVADEGGADLSEDVCRPDPRSGPTREVRSSQSVTLTGNERCPATQRRRVLKT